MAQSNIGKRKFPGYSDLVTCTCDGDIDEHYFLHPELSIYPQEFFISYYWCTKRGKRELIERLDKIEKQLRKEDQDEWIIVLEELPKIDPEDV